MSTLDSHSQQSALAILLPWLIYLHAVVAFRAVAYLWRLVPGPRPRRNSRPLGQVEIWHRWDPWQRWNQAKHLLYSAETSFCSGELRQYITTAEV